jgi:hypothetical protein
VPIALVLSAGLVWVGCGGGSNATSSGSGAAPPSMVSRAVFVKKAKEICARAGEERGEASEAFYERRAEETGEGLGAVGAVELVPRVVVPSLRRELDELEAVGLPRGKAYEAEAVWQTLRTVLHQVEAEGVYAWRSAKLLPPFRNRARPFGLEACVVN